jgi:hypothetical protein
MRSSVLKRTHNSDNDYDNEFGNVMKKRALQSDINHVPLNPPVDLLASGKIIVGAMSENEINATIIAYL